LPAHELEVPPMATTRPFAQDRVSLRLYPHNELTAAGLVRELCDQAALGLSHGFTGVMTSEHHGGVGGYFCNPMQLTTFILEENDVGWAAACPMLLPLRPTAQVAEETAWLAARHPGRVGLGVAAGAMRLDFDSMGVPLEEAVDRFKAELPRVVAMLRGEDLRGLDADHAFEECARNPVPVLSAVASTGAARRAATVGAGCLYEGVSPQPKLARMTEVFREAGGTQPVVLIRRVWLGETQTEAIDAQRGFYQTFGGRGRPLGDDQTIATGDAAEMADRLVALCTACDVDHLNLRVHLPGFPADAIRAQIERLGDEVLPRVEAGLAARRTGGTGGTGAKA
jgi:alkanesulfonate monooxygenase SsuD/methylene tetrahydromethanopterin reductase-like flavin-dependent oxidoreductase (luciferase family)